MNRYSEHKPTSKFRHGLHTIIFESDTRAGKLFDITLTWCILLSISAVMLDSVAGIRAQYGDLLLTIEWFFTFLFTVEYIFRLIAVLRPIRYAVSFFGIIDLLAVLPTYLSLALPGAQSLLVIRAFRLLRIFRILRLRNYLDEAMVLQIALRSARPKIVVFLLAVGATVLTMGTLMYLVEGEESGFSSIPIGVYWAVVTMTTVGFGDITPRTPLGQFFASALMIIGYGVIAVPTGVFTRELIRSERPPISTQACPVCLAEVHDIDAVYCKYCGTPL